jgi:hypothetical protein
MINPRDCAMVVEGITVLSDLLLDMADGAEDSDADFLQALAGKLREIMAVIEAYERKGRRMN